MASNLNVEKLFLRLFMFSHKVSLQVVRTYFISSVLCQSDYNNDIVTFLEHHKHELFHLVGDYKCCQCTKLPSLQPTVYTFRLGNNQFKKLYDVGNSKSGHFTKGSGGRIFQKCLCCITAKKDTNPKTYDISLLNALIYNCVQLSANNMLWLDTIRKLRNQLCHVHDISDLTKSELQTWWGKLECSVLNLAGEVHAQPAFKETIELLVDTFKYADYSMDTIAPLIEAVKAEINNNVNGVIQHQSEKLVDHMNTLSKQSEEQRNLDKKESQKQLLAVTTEISDTVEACHSKGKRFTELQTIELKGAIEEHQQKEESLLCAIHKEIIKGNAMSHKRDQISFDIQLTNETNPTTSQECPIKHTEDTENVESKEKCIVEFKISTQGSIGKKKEVIKQYFEKAVEMINIAAPFEVKYVRDGSITIGALLPVDILKNEEEFKNAICIFLDQMVTNCNIETSMPEVVKVKIMILNHEQTGTVKCFIEETKQMTDKAVQAVPIMVDQIIEADESEICLTYNNTALWLYGMEIKERVSTAHSDRKSTYDSDDEKLACTCIHGNDDILLIGCCKDIDWIGSVVTVSKRLTPICPIEQKQKSKKVLNRENMKAVIYVASMSSQQSYDLKWMIESLTQSRYMPTKAFTVVRDKVMAPDIFPESKQFHVRSEQNEWLPDLIDAFVKLGIIYFSLDMAYDRRKLTFERLGSFFGKTRGILLVGNYRNVVMIGSFLSKYRHMPCPLNYEIHLKKKSSRLLDSHDLNGIIFILSQDFKVETLFHPDIIHLQQGQTKVVTLVINWMTLPAELKETKQIDATGYYEDWLPEFIAAIQQMLSIVWILKCSNFHRFQLSTKEEDGQLILLMGNMRDVQWFNSVILKSGRFRNMKLEQTYLQQILCSIKCVICVITKQSEEEFQLPENITRSDGWPKKVVTIVREQMKIPKILMETQKVYVTDNDTEWLADLLCIFMRTGMTNFLRPDEEETQENNMVF
ncbi:uncharacterized protein [Mytilus edulis]|uniref:uncharacterized protein n=1 Tax=Mytilus edulis TaxID=6550 RepID=UPI0039F05163